MITYRSQIHSTIFKTYETDLDGFTNKLGFSRRSFAEWGSQVSQSFRDAGYGLDGLKAGFAAAFNGGFQPNDISLIAASDFNSLFGSDPKSFFNDFNASGNQSMMTLTQWCNRFEQMDTTMRSYLTDCMQKQVPASFEGYNSYVKSAIASNKQMTLSAKATSVAMNALSAVGNMAVTALVFKGIELAAKAVDQYVNRVKYAVEAMEKAQQAIIDSQNRLSDVTATIEENRDRFIELSEGVDKFSGNVSLSDEDYAEYLSISNTLAEIAPDLVSGFTAQGDALLYIGDSAEEANEKLNGVLESEQAIAKQELIDNMGAVAEGIYQQTKQAQQEIANLQSELNEYSSFEALQMPENFIQDVDGTTKMISYGTQTGLSFEEIEKLKELIFASGARVIDDAAFDSMSFLAEDAPLVENAIKDFYDGIATAERKRKSAYITGLKKDIQEQEQLIADLYSKMTPNISSWVQDTYEYDFLDLEQKNLVDALVPNLDWKSIKAETGKEFATDIEYEEYIRENILNPLLNIPEKYQDEVNGKFAKLLSFESGDIGIVDYVSDLEKYLSGHDVNICLTPLIGDTGELKESYDRAMSDAALKYIEGGSKNYGSLEAERKSLEDFAKENSINTKGEIEFWNQCLEESRTKEEAMQNYLENAPFLNGESSLTFDSEGFLDSVSSIQSCYDTLLSAQNEYNEYGAITELYTITK